MKKVTTLLSLLTLGTTLAVSTSAHAQTDDANSTTTETTTSRDEDDDDHSNWGLAGLLGLLGLLGRRKQETPVHTTHNPNR